MRKSWNKKSWARGSKYIYRPKYISHICIFKKEGSGVTAGHPPNFFYNVKKKNQNPFGDILGTI